MTSSTAVGKEHSGRALLVVTALTLSCAADTMTVDLACDGPAPQAAVPVPADTTGRLIVLPGVGNTKYHLAPFVERATRQLPGFEIDFRPWGVPFLIIRNIQAEARNAETARQMAREISDWRRAHPDELLYLFGYSGGGGLATLIVSELPDDVTVDRLVLMAPAISPDYPIGERVLSKVKEFAVNYASTYDVQVGWGTRNFGTIDRVDTNGAGAVGFDAKHPDLLQWHWRESYRALGHRGNHRSYLAGRWQYEFLLPAIDPRLSADDVRARWARACGSP